MVQLWLCDMCVFVARILATLQVHKETVAAVAADSSWSCVQVECHPYFRNEALLQWCKSRRIHVTAYSPLGSPDSASMFKRKAPLLMQDPVVKAIAERLSRSPAQVRLILTLSCPPLCPALPCPALPCPATSPFSQAPPFQSVADAVADANGYRLMHSGPACAVAGCNITSHLVIMM